MSHIHTFTLLNKVIDDTFDVDLLHEYTLSILVSSGTFQFCVVHTAKNRCVMLEHYEYPHQNNVVSLLAVLKEIYDYNSYLNAGFWRCIKLNIKNLKFSLVPNALFAESYAKDILSVNCTLAETEALYYYKHSGNDTINVFATEQAIVEWFKKMYANKLVDVVHHTSSMMEGVLQYPLENQAKSVFVNVEDGIATIAVRDHNNLIFINNFKFVTANDLLYYTLFVYDGLDLNIDSIPLILMGNIQKNSDFYQRLYKYIRHIYFSQRPNGLKFGYKFDEIGEHHYFGLYNTILC